MIILDRETIDRRLAALVAATARAGLDAAAIVPGANFYYLTGGRFSAMERPTILIVTAAGERRAVLPGLRSDDLGEARLRGGGLSLEG